MNTTTAAPVTTTTAVVDVRRGDVIVDGAGQAWVVQSVACPMEDMRGVFFTFVSGGTYRYLTDDTVELHA